MATSNDCSKSVSARSRSDRSLRWDRAALGSLCRPPSQNLLGLLRKEYNDPLEINPRKRSPSLPNFQRWTWSASSALQMH